MTMNDHHDNWLSSHLKPYDMLQITLRKMKHIASTKRHRRQYIRLQKVISFPIFSVLGSAKNSSVFNFKSPVVMPVMPVELSSKPPLTVRWTLTNSPKFAIFISTAALFRHCEGTWSRSISLPCFASAFNYACAVSVKNFGPMHDRDPQSEILSSQTFTFHFINMQIS